MPQVTFASSAERDVGDTDVKSDYKFLTVPISFFDEGLNMSDIIVCISYLLYPQFSANGISKEL